MRCGWREIWLGTIAVACSVMAATQAWSTRPGDGEALTLHVYKARHEMRLFNGDHVVRKFNVALGKDPMSTKLQRGDGRTPEGRYYICEKRANSKFRRFLGISYPNVDDAEKGFAERIITADEWADIFFANLRQTVPPWSTALGGRVGIHGYGGRAAIPVDWTEGCIAVSDADIDYLYDRVPLGTPVIIGD